MQMLNEKYSRSAYEKILNRINLKHENIHG